MQIFPGICIGDLRRPVIAFLPENCAILVNAFAVV